MEHTLSSLVIFPLRPIITFKKSEHYIFLFENYIKVVYSNIHWNLYRETIQPRYLPRVDFPSNCGVPESILSVNWILILENYSFQM